MGRNYRSPTVSFNSRKLCRASTVFRPSRRNLCRRSERTAAFFLPVAFGDPFRPQEMGAPCPDPGTWNTTNPTSTCSLSGRDRSLRSFSPGLPQTAHN